MLYHEDDLAMISALQHLLFCPRQCALIHIEQLWVENQYTAEGRIMHERVHTAGKESRREVRVEYDLPVRSLVLGLVGRCDIVEFHKVIDAGDGWIPFPVEYKRGKPKAHRADEVQLCAQAMCLEEMLDVQVAEGALYYGKTRKRQPIIFDEKLRQLTVDTALALHQLYDAQMTPKPKYNKKCEACSFIDLCMPKQLDNSRSVCQYLNNL